MKAILHIGHSKTGTSHLQNTLALNYSQLLEQGVYYPVDFRAVGNNDYQELARQGRVSSGNGHPFYRSLRKQETRWIDSWLDRLTEIPAEHLVLSSESFFYSPRITQAMVHMLRSRGHSVLVYASLPSLESGVIAGYAQNVRNHMFHRDIFSFLEKLQYHGQFRFLTTHRSLIAQVEPDEVVILPYVRDGVFGKGIVDDFFVACGLPSTTLSEASGLNRSLSAEANAVIQLANAFGDVNLSNRLVHTMEQADGGGTRLFDYLLTAELQSLVWERYGKQVKGVAPILAEKAGDAAVERWMAKATPTETLLDESHLRKLARLALRPTSKTTASQQSR